MLCADSLGKKRPPALVATFLAAILATLPLVACAYRPFDSTDADVAAAGEVELELGALGFLRQGEEAFLSAPSFGINFGLPDEREIVLQGQVQSQLKSADGTRPTSLEDTGLFLKQVHRARSLQGMAGPSLATECGVLLPTIKGESGVGASCAGILSERWRTATTHLNAALSWNRQHRPEYFLGWILEGPNAWPLRPALELLADHQSNASPTRSELRAGLTWDFSLERKP